MNADSGDIKKMSDFANELEAQTRCVEYSQARRYTFWRAMKAEKGRVGR